MLFLHDSNSLVAKVKMLLKLAITSDDHLVEYKARITHCSNHDLKILDCLKSIILDNDENFLNSHETLEVLVGAGSFAHVSLFDKECLEQVSIIELQKSLSKQGMKCFFFLFINF